MPAGKAKESRAYGGPSRYIQGPGEIENLPLFVANFGKSALLLIDPFFYDEYEGKMTDLFAAHDMKAYPVRFPGICSRKSLAELTDYCEGLPEIPSAFIGIGGGQTCDLNKAIGAGFRGAIINVPTALSTDAPTSTHSILNGEDGLPFHMTHYKNPDYVVVDTEITIQSPPYMFASGIGDALATYIEAKATIANNNVCNVEYGKYRPTRLGYATAKLSFDVLMEKGVEAMRAAEAHLRTPAYEDVAEATVLLSGIGYECTNSSLSHGLAAGFHVLPGKPLLHGTSVGYSVLVQLIVENDIDLFRRIFEFTNEIGLPVCTDDLGLSPENRNEYVEKLLSEVYPAKWSIHNVPFHVSRDMLKNAIYYLDVYAKNHRR